MSAASGNSIGESILALLCVGFVLVLSLLPGVALALLTRKRWNNGTERRRLVVSALNGLLTASALGVAAAFTFLSAASMDERGIEGSFLAFACGGVTVVMGPLGAALTYLPLFLARRKSSPQASVSSPTD